MPPGPKMRPGGRGNARHMMPGTAAEKPKNAKATLKRQIKLLKPERLLIVLVVVFTIASTVFSVISPAVLGQVTTEIFRGFKDLRAGGAGIDFILVRNLLLIVAGLYFFSAAVSYLQQFFIVRAVQNIIFELRQKAKEKLDRLPLSYFDARPKGEVLSRMVNDVDVISSTLQDTLVQTISSIVTFTGVLVMMLAISPLMTLIALATIPLSLLVTVFFAKRAQKYFAGQQSSLGTMNAHIEESYGGYGVIKAFAREEATIGEFEKRNNAYYDNAWRAEFVTGVIRPAMGAITNIAYVAVCVLGGALVVRGSMAVGQIQAFLQYMRNFSQPITQLASVSNIIQLTLASAERIFEIIDEDEMSEDPAESENVNTAKGHVRFDHVNFGYVPGKPVIKDFSFEALPGQTIAIVGPTGAGKTTLMNLLMRFYEIDSGSISIDGIDTASLSRSELRSHFGMVLQDTWLFSGSVRENIAYGNDESTDEEIVAAAKSARAHRFIMSLPEGYDTVINEEANNISTGQKQLITIARAILAKPSVFILDEATSSIDTRTEQLVQKAMHELMKTSTCFVIAHRLSTIREADCILVLRDGDVVEQGSHEELLRLNGFYASLYNSQFSDCIDEIE